MAATATWARWAWGRLAALGLAIAACGGGDAPEALDAPGRAMSDTRQDAASTAPSRVGNSSPVIERVRLQPGSPRPGERVTADVDASDPDGDRVELVYQWRVDGRRIGHVEPWLHVEGFGRDSQIELTVFARDGKAQSEPVTRSVYVGNQPPVIQGVVLEPLKQVSAGHDVSADPRAKDPDGDELEFFYTWWVNGEQLDVRGPVLSDDHFRRKDRIELEVVASDGSDDSEPLRSDPIEVVNAEPRITSEPGAVGEDGVFRYAVRVEDPDGDRLFRYRLLRGPEGMELGVVNGSLSWKPAAEQAGTHPVEIEVDDRAGGVSTQSFEVRIAFEAPEPEAPAAPAP